MSASVHIPTSKTVLTAQIATFLSVVVLLSACAPALPAAPVEVAAETTPTATAIASPTPSPVTPSPTATLILTPTPTPTIAFPVPVGTPLPDLQPLTGANALNVELVRKFTYGKVYTSIFTPDLQRLIVMADNALILDGNTLEILYQIPASINIRLAPDGKTLALFNPDGHVEIWDVYSGQKLHTLILENPAAEYAGFYVFCSLNYSHDSRLISTADGGRLRIWDVESGVQVQEFSGIGGAFSQVAGWFALSTGSEVIIYDADWQPVYHWQIISTELSSFIFSPDGKYLVAEIFIGETGPLYYSFDLETGRPMANIPTPREYYTYLSLLYQHSPYSLDGQLMVEIDQNLGVGTLRLVQTGETVCTFEWTDPDEFPLKSFSADSTRLVVSGSAGMLKIYDTATCELLAERDGFVYDRYRRVFPSPDNRFLFLTGKVPSLLDAQTGELIRTFEVETFGVEPRYAAFTPDSRYVILADNSGIISLDLTTGEVTAAWGDTWITSQTYAPNSAILAVYNVIENHIDLLNVPSLEQVGSLDYPFSIRHDPTLAFSPDGRLLAIGGNRKDILIFDVETHKLQMTLEAQTYESELVAFSPDGEYLAAVPEFSNGIRHSNVKPRLQVWQIADGEKVLEFELRPEHLTQQENVIQRGIIDVFSLMFSPDGSHILLTGKYGKESENIMGGTNLSPLGYSMIALPMDDGEPLIRYNIPWIDYEYMLYFSPDGRLLYWMDGLFGVRE